MSDRGQSDVVRRLVDGGRRLLQDVVGRRESDAYGQGFSDAADACLYVVDQRKRELEAKFGSGSLAKHDQMLLSALTTLRHAMLDKLREVEQPDHGVRGMDSEHVEASDG